MLSSRVPIAAAAGAMKEHDIADLLDGDDARGGSPIVTSSCEFWPNTAIQTQDARVGVQLRTRRGLTS